jgi:hypothetical protein
MTQSSDFRADIEEAVKALSLSASTFKLVSLHEYEPILVSILERFTTLGKKGLNASWLWAALQEPHTSIHVAYPPGVLQKLVLPQEKVWFVAEDWRRTKRHGNFWLYEGTVAAIVKLLGEVHGFEYCIVSKKFEWLLGEDHHGVLTGVGQLVMEKIENLKTSSEM